MIPKERVRTALEGGKPDQVPIVPIYDFGYMMRSTGRDIREWVTASAQDRIDVIEESFLLHDVDGYFVHVGCNDDWVNSHAVEKRDTYWMVTGLETGERYRLLPDGSRAEADGTPITRGLASGGVSKIQTWEDLDRELPAPHTQADVAASGALCPLRHLVLKYPDHHFSVQAGTPMVYALNACGGYVEGLLTMASNRPLFRDLLSRCAENQYARIAEGHAVGAHSLWFTSYYTGGDTISPRDYAELVFPFDYEICQAAKARGMYVLHWYLGNLMPVLDIVMQLPMDALVLEQGRKGYQTDPVEIRKRVGPRFCLFGFGYENDYCTDNREALSGELKRQIAGAGREGAFVVGTPIMPPNALPEAVDFYFSEARRLGRY